MTRRPAARIGLVLLNLLAPGLGLLRLGRWQVAAALFAVAIAFLLFVNFAPPVGFGLFALAAAIGLATYPVAFVMTWLASRTIPPNPPRYTRWWALVAMTLASFVLSYVLSDEQRVRYRSFFLPAESMAPTLPVGARFFGYMQRPQTLERGDLLLVRAADGSIYVKRLAGLPGDRIGMRNGTVLLNGVPLAQTMLSRESITTAFANVDIERRQEQFPGERAAHLIYDSGPSPIDEVDEQMVRPGHVFVLGDNRDNSADSRTPRSQMGLEQVPLSDIVGWPLFHSFGSNRPIGEPINREGMR